MIISPSLHPRPFQAVDSWYVSSSSSAQCPPAEVSPSCLLVPTTDGCPTVLYRRRKGLGKLQCRRKKLSAQTLSCGNAKAKLLCTAVLMRTSENGAVISHADKDGLSLNSLNIEASLKSLGSEKTCIDRSGDKETDKPQNGDPSSKVNGNESDFDSTFSSEDSKSVIAKDNKGRGDESLPLPSSEDEKLIIEREKLRRMKISEANKGQIPWNKGKTYVIGTHSGSNKDSNDVDNDTELLEKEKKRRQRIAAANKGKVPWNKGRAHSEETKRRIRERTAEAMKNPVIREKLRIHGSTLSPETKSKISSALAVVWDNKKKLKIAQENCVEEWQEYIANAARMGGIGDVEHEWDSYQTLFRELQAAWRISRKKRKKKDSKSGLSIDHRIKISNAIKKKWADRNYRNTVEAAIQAHWAKQGDDSPARRKRKKKVQKVESENDSDEEFSEDEEDDSDATSNASEPSLMKRAKDLPAYKNPSSQEMMAKLQKMRANRASEEARRMEAMRRARTLMAEAHRATKALEAAAAKDKNSIAALQEARKLLAEAEESFKMAGLKMEDILDSSNFE